ncbi:MAG: dienelactone hydrolase family protein [Deltaproteobacteria bacterium]
MKKLLCAVSGAILFAACASSKSSESGASSQPAMEEKKSDAMSSKITTEEVQYDVNGVKLTGFVAYDASKEGPRPGILVVHEWWGHNDYARKRAEMLAELGYTGFALDMYGDGKQADHPKDAQKFMMEVMNDAEAMSARFRAAYDLLAQHDSTDPGKIGAIGYCFGGAVVLNMARAGVSLDGVAAFHAGALAGPMKAKTGDVKGKILVLHGGADPFVPPEQVTAFKEEMQAAGVSYEFVEYEGAKHAFTNPGATEKGKKFELPLAYDAEADKKSWEKMKSFFASIY